MKFQIDYLIFIRSLREGNFKLIVNILMSLVKCFFIFDQYNYARWISVHIQDLLMLPITCPQLHQEFEAGNFVVQISGREFSRIHYDQAHEQSNKTIKSISGPIDFVNRASDALQRRWEIAGHEIAEYLEQVEDKIVKGREQNDTHHHEDNPTHNAMFKKDYATIIGRLLPVNPFLEESLIKVGTNVEYNEQVCDFVDAIPEIGQQQYKEFVDSRLVKCKKLVSDTIKKNNFVIPAKSIAKTNQKKSVSLKESDFNKLRAATSFRPSLCAELFKTEMTGLPECLTKEQQMYHSNKSQLLNTFDPLPSLTPTMKADAIVLDFSALVNSQATSTTAKTFKEFSDGITDFVQNLSVGCSRIDVVCDSYFDNSLKTHTRETRGCGQFFPFTETTLIPKNFQGSFLRHNKNKVALNSFLAERLLTHDFGGAIVFISVNDEIMCNSSDVSTSYLSMGCTQEEADTKIIVHAKHCHLSGFRKVVVKTVDTDVITLVLSHLSLLDPPCEIEVDFNFGKDRKFYNINNICSRIIPEQCLALPFFFTFTGCDITSSFYDISKCT